MALAALLAGCGEKKEPETLVRPVRSEIVTGGASSDSATYTAEIRSRYETDLSFQVAGKLVGAKGRVLATDILPMEPIKNVDFIQGDFTDEAVVAQLLDWLGGGKFDLIISDIAPNITGIDSADQASSMYFLELALDTVRQTLKPGAIFVAKMFQGSGSDQYVKDLRTSFEKVLIRKPAASRAESREVYIVAKGFRG